MGNIGWITANVSRPAFWQASRVDSRTSMGSAPGSKACRMPSSSVGTDSPTHACSNCASSGMSSAMRAARVSTQGEKPCSRRTCRQRRVMRWRRSNGWYGSVTTGLSRTTPGLKRGDFGEQHLRKVVLHVDPMAPRLAGQAGEAPGEIRRLLYEAEAAADRAADVGVQVVLTTPFANQCTGHAHLTHMALDALVHVTSQARKATLPLSNQLDQGVECAPGPWAQRTAFEKGIPSVQVEPLSSRQAGSGLASRR